MENINLLLIEDNEIDFLTFSRMCNKNKLPVNVVHCKSVPEALSMLNSREFHLIVSDFMLPGDSIIDLGPYLQKIPFIIATGLSDEKVRDFCIENKALAYFVKDISGSYLLTMPVLLNHFLLQKNH